MSTETPYDFPETLHPWETERRLDRLEAAVGMTGWEKLGRFLGYAVALWLCLTLWTLLGKWLGLL